MGRSLTTLLVMIAVGPAFAACDSAVEQPGAVAGDTSAAEANDEVVWVDVRSPAEFASGHVEGAINIPHTEMRERHEELAPYEGKRLMLYCRSGRRSGIAQSILADEGYTNLVNAGGFSDLRAQGVPTTR